MTYSVPVKWPEAEAVILERMREAAQTRGYQAALARKIGKTPGFVNHIVTGDKPIPVEHLDAVLESLNLSYDVVLSELTVKPKAPDGES